jgi:AraC-like DNA-binding protein
MANLDKEGFDASELAIALALSRSQLYRKLKPLVGFSPAHYIRYVRLQKAKEYLEKGEGNIGDVAFNVGFVSQSHFTRAFKEQFGFNPSHITRQQHN